MSISGPSNSILKVCDLYILYFAEELFVERFDVNLLRIKTSADLCG
jgi:hypothetical protein